MQARIRNRSHWACWPGMDTHSQLKPFLSAASLQVNVNKHGAMRYIWTPDQVGEAEDTRILLLFCPPPNARDLDARRNNPLFVHHPMYDFKQCIG